VRWFAVLSVAECKCVHCIVVLSVAECRCVHCVVVLCSQEKQLTVVGSPYWMAPECIMGLRYCEKVLSDKSL